MDRNVLRAGFVVDASKVSLHLDRSIPCGDEMDRAEDAI